MNTQFLKKSNKLVNLRSSTPIMKDHLWLKFMKVLLWLYSIPSRDREHFFVLFHRIMSIKKKNGNKFCVLYLKEAHRLVSWWLSGSTDFKNEGSVRVSTRGLPLIIPGQIRHILYGQGPDMNKTFKCLLSLLSSYRIISFEGILKLETITAPFTGKSKTLPSLEISRALKSLNPSRRLNLPKLDDTNKGPSLVLATTAGPNGNISIKNTLIDAYALTKNALVLDSLIRFAEITSHKVRDLLIGDLKFMDVYKKLPDNKKNIRRIKPVHKQVIDITSGLIDDSSLSLGKLSIKEEAAGKLRVFAMVDIWTQSILSPLHKALFDLVRELPMDGTFDQLKPLTHLTGSDRFSYDLSAATDRLPIDLQRDILTYYIGQDLSDCWKNILIERDYKLTYKKCEHVVRYAVGQPMGALSSWGMLALTHHVIVQISAQRAGWSELFVNYALLGDDICIADKAVAKEYLSIMDDLGVSINLSKSMVSSTSTLEFAKRWFRGTEDLSPVSPNLISRLLTNINYLPVILGDLKDRGIRTIVSNWSSFDDLGLKLTNRKLSLNKKLNLNSYVNLTLLSWVCPQGDGTSLTVNQLEKVLNAIDRTFNKLKVESFYSSKEQEKENRRLSSEDFGSSRSLLLMRENDQLVVYSGSIYELYREAYQDVNLEPDFSPLKWKKSLTSVNYVSVEMYLQDTIEMLSDLPSPSFPDLSKKVDRSNNLNEAKKVGDYLLSVKATVKKLLDN